MNTGLYAAFLGMRARQQTLDTIANNIANASTSGFKADRLFHHSIEVAEAELLRVKPIAGAVGGIGLNGTNGTDGTNGVSLLPSASTDADAIHRVFGILSGGVTDYATGSLRETGRPLDVALDGQGFLVVQTPRGERYTRAGAFTLNADGQLVTQQGDLVVGESGPIAIPRGKNTIGIGTDGSVSADGQTIGKLRVVRFNDTRAALTKEGDSLFALTDKEQPQNAFGTRVVQGALEMSNVNVVSEMAQMMHNSREFDSLQRSVTLMMSDVGRKVANELGRL
ncbi:MAG: flagellar basal-body rod protein FlgF [Blastocatellia bacterium]